MQIYETVVVLHPRLSDEEIAQFGEETKQMVSKAGGEIISEDKWGRRKLAYPIQRAREGYYLYLKYRAKGEFVAGLSKHFRLLETILRTLTVHAEEPRRSAVKKAPKAQAAVAAAPAVAR